MEDKPIETFSPVPEPEHKMFLTDEAQYYIQIIAKWGNFLSIIGFIMCALLLLLGSFISSIMSSLSAMGGNPMAGSVQGVMTVMYVLIAIFYFFPTLYLFQFSSKAKKAILFANSAELAEAFGKLKSCFKFIGIVTIVILSIYALVFIAGIIGMSTYSAFRQ
ncbi:DUF5362 family protein [uncultured Mucilaginibacter sp.]|uniref:DUF5362 family protein n=1 Tax=uncultured Mucilaginibacter sp. TaxID=797541 RepID=UPI0025DF1360|nr:DUF5362 family protein [uncultured Mucilaginibacter sp.]